MLTGGGGYEGGKVIQGGTGLRGEGVISVKRKWMNSSLHTLKPSQSEKKRSGGKEKEKTLRVRMGFNEETHE